MELVYLWVEDYKNIQKQGFNFSPRFECHYDEDSNELKIDEKKDYVDIFPDNINVTAIVGENGSGKSSIVYQLLTNNKFVCSNIKENNFIDKKLWVLDDSDNISTWHCEDISFYNNVILYNEDRDSSLYTNQYNINQYLENKLKITERYIAYNISISFFIYANRIEYLDEFSFLPTHIELNLIDKVTEDELNNLIGYRFEMLNDYDSHDLITVNIDHIREFKEFINSQLKAAIDNFHNGTSIKNYLCIREFIYKINNNDKNSLDIFEHFISNNYEVENFSKQIINNTFAKDSVFRDIIESINNIDKSINLNKILIHLRKNNIESLLSNIHRGFFDIDFLKITDKDEHVYFSDLSSGEQKFILIFSKIFYIIRKLFCENQKDYILFLDEPDIFLHPNWQKKFLTYLIEFINNTNILKGKKFNIILTSHSPFILSDLPKENVIFLKEGKQVDVDIDTFGANIHTLLSHGFFMKNGLMGEFAKSKIDKAIKYLNQKKLHAKEIDYCEDIISIVGEPILKRQLQKMLDSKRLYKVDDINQKIKDMEYELSILKKHQKKATTDELKDKAKRKYTQKKSDKNE